MCAAAFRMESAPKVEPVMDGELWRLTEDFAVYVDGFSFYVPKGFVTDGASIPRFLWRVCGHPLEAKRFPAAVAHDWMYYEDTGCDRATADRLYRVMLVALGVPAWRAWVEWGALRLFGARRWNALD